MSVEASLYNTPLTDVHVAMGAKMVGFGGWNMPLQYESILAEWEYNRKAASLFDCSHMGEFIIKGDALTCGLDVIVTHRIADMPINSCRYGLMLNEGGGIIDDLIVYRKGHQEWMVVVNASNIEKDAHHFRSHLKDPSCFEDVSFKTAKLDLQGPRSRDVLKVLAPGIERLSYYTFDKFTIAGVPCLISRTGYTGELGYEIYCPWEKCKEIWQNILNNDTVKPTGLGVRDVLRLEMCYSLYGHELSQDICASEAGLDRFVDGNKEFIGKKASGGSVSRGIGYFISASRKSPRAGNKLLDAAGREIGITTSGSFSPALNLGIGIGLMECSFAAEAGTRIFFGDGKIKTAALVAKRPFYKKGSFKA